MDERRNLPSASGLERLYECRGSRKLEEQLSDISEASPYAEMGRRIHEALEGTFDPQQLNDDEFWVFERSKEYEEEIKRLVFPDESIWTQLEISAEERLWLLDDNGKPVASGKSDKRCVYRAESHALISDYKTGWNAVSDPATNIQLRMYAVLTALKYRVEKVTVAIIQPRCNPPYAICTYEKGDLEYATSEIMTVLSESEREDAKRVAGVRQCQWCRAKAFCPEAKQFVMESVGVVADAMTKISKKEIRKREALLPGKSVEDLLDKRKMMSGYIGAVEEEARMRLKEGRTVPGYAEVFGGRRKYVTNTYEMYEFIVHKKKWLSPQDAMSMMEFRMGDLQKLATTRIRVHKNISVDKLLGNIFGALIGWKDNEKKLERIADTRRKAKGQKIIRALPQRSTLGSLFGRAR